MFGACSVVPWELCVGLVDLLLLGRAHNLIQIRIRAELDTAHYESGIKVSDEALNAVQIERNEFHGEWNYSIRPNKAIG